MSKKQPLTLQNLEDGDLIAKINEAIIAASKAVGASENPKAKAELTVKIIIENGDTEDCFRRVTTSLVPKFPVEAKRPRIYPLAFVDGERVIAVDPTQDGEQVKIPGVANIRSAS